MGKWLVENAGLKRRNTNHTPLGEGELIWKCHSVEAAAAAAIFRAFLVSPLVSILPRAPLLPPNYSRRQSNSLSQQNPFNELPVLGLRLNALVGSTKRSSCRENDIIMRNGKSTFYPLSKMITAAAAAKMSSFSKRRRTSKLRATVASRHGILFLFLFFSFQRNVKKEKCSYLTYVSLKSTNCLTFKFHQKSPTHT